MLPALGLLLALFAVLHFLRKKSGGEQRTGKSCMSLPKTGADWIHLFLVPAKTYAVVGYPFLAIGLRLVGSFQPLDTDAPVAAQQIFTGYWPALLILIFGAVLQAKVRRFWPMAETLCFVCLGLVFRSLTGAIEFAER